MRLLRHRSFSGAQALSMGHRADADSRALIIVGVDRMGPCNGGNVRYGVLKDRDDGQLYMNAIIRLQLYKGT